MTAERQRPTGMLTPADTPTPCGSVSPDAGSADARVSGRRGFLLGAGAMVALSAIAAPRVARAVVLGVNERRLNLRHAYTNEVFDGLYFAEGEYVQEQLASINHLLRDYHVDQAHEMDPELLDTLNNVQTLVDRPIEFVVTSAYRTAQTNRRLRKTEGAARHSLHLEGKAIDIKVDGIPMHRLGDIAMSLRAGGVGFYRSSSFIHLDTGDVRTWSGRGKRRRARA
ncbi:MAG: YcbK family protein [Alphaproteobacteria bacterium]|nr:YcbK family protein [Alphaproteobacteria bacterium]